MKKYLLFASASAALRRDTSAQSRRSPDRGIGGTARLALCALLFAFAPMAQTHATLPAVLSDSDATVYAAIFDLTRLEKHDEAKKLESEIEDKTVMAEVLFQRYMSKKYIASGQEVAAWMSNNYDMPGADRMFKLANRKKAAAHAPKLTPIASPSAEQSAQSESWTAQNYSGETAKKIASFKNALRRGNTKNARNILEDSAFAKKLGEVDYGRLCGRLAFVYYTDGRFELAREWGTRAADARSEYGLWTLGLMSYKEGDFASAQQYFSSILDAEQINDARKQEIAFWAGRAAEMNNKAGTAKKFWKTAATRPQTFYGALAAAKMGHTPEYEFFEQNMSDDDISILLGEKYGWMALALLQVNEPAAAEKYLRQMLTRGASDRMLHAVHSVASVVELPRTSMLSAALVKERGIMEIDPNVIFTAQYPMPDWEPMGGFGIDRALLFAITKQESEFKTDAKSRVGASGVMQLMPKTVKIVARQNNVKMSELDISNPEHNMFLGQQYVADLFALPGIDNDIIKMLVSYNAGPGAKAKFEQCFETSDPLLYIESFPFAETRGYVRRVLANLWLYRARLNQPVESIKTLANGEWLRYESADEFVHKKADDDSI